MSFLHNYRLNLTKSLFITTLFMLAQGAFSAAISEPESDYYPDWSQILAEGNGASFSKGLLEVTECLHEERKRNQTVSEAGTLSLCQKKAKHIVTLRNKAGESLLKQFMYLDHIADSELVNVLAMLEYIGFDIYGLKSETGDSVLFHAAEKHELNFIINLLASVKKDHPDILVSFSDMRSEKGELLADMLLKRFPDRPTIAIYINLYHLAPDISKLTESSSYAYLALKLSRVEL